MRLHRCPPASSPITLHLLRSLNPNSPPTTPASPGDAVAPNQTVTYTWLVPDRAGPGPNDFSSIMWMYHSHVNEAADPYAGLFGAIIITKQELANEDATPRDVDR
jgi:hypothetical protein